METVEELTPRLPGRFGQLTDTSVQEERAQLCGSHEGLTFGPKTG